MNLDERSTKMIGSEDGNVEMSDVDNKLSEKQESEKGELEEGELDDEVDDLQPQANLPDREITPPEADNAHTLESDFAAAKSERRREKHDTDSGKSKSHSRHRSGSRLTDSSSEPNKDDDGRESHSRSQRHSKRRDKQRSKDDSEKKSSSTYIDFDSMQDDYGAENSWARPKKSRHSRESVFDSPSGSDENFEAEDVVQTLSRSYHSSYQYYDNYYDEIQENEEEKEEEDETDPLDHDSEQMDSGSQQLKNIPQDGGRKGSPGRYNRSSSNERRVRNQMPRKRKLVDTPMEERPACKFFMEGKCSKGSDCPFNHDFVPPKKDDICRFYLNERGCTRENCVFYHDDWPCRHFHRNGTCAYGDDCKFSHAELTDETKHLIFLDPSHEHHSDNWKSANSDSMSSSEKKKIPSLLDLEIYPPGMEPKITGPNFLSRGSYKRQRSSGQPGLLGAGPLNFGGTGSRVTSRMRPMGGGMKGYCSSYVNDPFGFDDPGSLHFSHSPDYESRFPVPIEGGDSDDDNDYDEPPRRRPGEKPDLDISDIDKTEDCQPLVQVDPSNLPTVQQDLYRRIQQHQQQPQQQDSQQNDSAAKKSANYEAEEKWYSSDEEVNDAKTTVKMTPAVTVTSNESDKPFVEEGMHRQQAVETVPPMLPPVFGTIPPRGMMPRGMPPPREILHLPDMMPQGSRPVQGMVPRADMRPRPENMPQGMMPQRTITPLSDIIPQSIGMMMTRSMVPSDMMQQQGMVPPSDMMRPNMLQRGMSPSVNMMGQMMLPQRAMMPPTDLLGHGMMPPRGLMPPSDIWGQGIMPPRGVPPPSDLMQLGMMPQRGLAPPSDMMSQGLIPPQGVPPLSDMPPRSTLPPGMLQTECRPPFNVTGQGIASMADFNISHILSIIQNSSLLAPATAGLEIMTNPPSNFNQSLDPRTTGIITDPRLRQNESEPTTIASSFLQPPESPDQEIEINGTGKKIVYTLHPILVESRPGLPSGISMENLATTNDPRLQKYLQIQSNSNTKSSNDSDSGETSIQGKPFDPRLPQRGIGDAKKVDGVEPVLNDKTKVTKPPKPYSLPDIILPVLPNSVQDISSIGRVTEATSTGKTTIDSSVQRIASPSIRSSEKTPVNLVELPEALQEQNYPKDRRLSRQTSTSSVSSSTTNSDKKIIDYRNDPRYKKKKTKLVLQDVTGSGQSDASAPTNEILSPTLSALKEEDSNHTKQNHQSVELKAAVNPLQSSSTGSFDLPYREEAEEQKTAAAVVVVVDESSSEHKSVSESSVHTPLTFFEGVPVSGNMSDVEPTEELNLKDMFKTIDPTTSPFC